MLLVAKLLLAVAGLYGIGCLVSWPLTARTSQAGFLERSALVMTCGLATNCALALLLPSLTTAFIVGGVLAVAGLAMPILTRRVEEPRTLARSRRGPIALLCACGVLAACFIKIHSEPLSDWDARSIWFFHAKMIYHQGALNGAAGWNDHSLQFSHVDYPKLVPALAAQCAHAAGYWNEYLPKAALFFTLIPLVFWLFSFARFSIGSLLLVCALPLGAGELLWNGLMDGYLALYFALAMLLLARYLKTLRPFDLVSSLCCLLVTLHLKNEGAMAAAAGLALIIISTRGSGLLRVFRDDWSRAVPVAAVALPHFVWMLCRNAWNLQNDLQIGAPGSFSRLATRSADGQSLTAVLDYTGRHVLPAVIVFLACSILIRALGKKPSRPALAVFLTATAYWFGLAVVYLLTPYDLAWHLNTSSDRTMLLVNLSMWSAVALLLDDFAGTDGMLVISSTTACREHRTSNTQHPTLK